MNDVAREAKVSRGTVSNYLNKERVLPESATRIKAAISKLHYVRNAAAAEMRTQSSRYVVFITPTVWTPFFAELTYHIQKALNQKNYKMILCVSNSRYDEEREYVEMAQEQKVAGIISISYSQMNRHVAPGMPLVSIEKDVTGLFPMVSSDNYSGGQLAAATLKQSGAKRQYFLGATHLESAAMQARYDGFKDYCEEHNIEFDIFKVPEIKDEKSLALKGISVMLNQLANSNKLIGSGIFTMSDEYGMAVYRQLQDMKVPVPAAVQIIGFDGGRATASDTPLLTSIRQPVSEIARTAVDEFNKMIHHQLEGPVPRIQLPISLYQGQTTQESK
ncbi:LacI family DNA-binding transcriptional regulator [Oenococcus kitaharae]|nr:LacI family DNA-binding transcriptional regulator [Oenococcus kitaharae]OEY84690.1 hypothetical protein NT95_00955 [Oenococcus kitaharae]OEY84974.1 hypothetical protein NT96_02525 [Oenococcus kitaharae]OEY85764.1 hypothetical protein NV75_02830 [Oenococcus kitaharae]